MSTSHPVQTTNESCWKLWIITSFLITCAATALRLALNFRHALPPGIDAGYYPMQTRWLIEYDELAREAPPLIFWLNALMAKFILTFTGMNLDDACVLSSRLVDCLTHPWIVLPIMMLGYRWARGRRATLFACAAAAILATISPPAMRMASDFQKNSAGLVCVAFGLWALREALDSRNNFFLWICVAVCFVSAALTHMGAFGLACVLVGSGLIAYFVIDKSNWLSPKQLPRIAAVIGCLLAIGFVVYWISPDWSYRLIKLPTRALSLVDLRTSLISVLFSLAVYWILGKLLVKIWQSRQELGPSDTAVAIACIFGLAVLMFPFLTGTWSMRFKLMAPVPGTILLALVFARFIDDKSNWQKKCLYVTTAILAMASPFFMQGPAITKAASDELKQLRRHVAEPAKTLVVAPHGIEFWAGFILHTQAKSGPIPSELGSYSQALIVLPKYELGDRGHPGPRQRPDNRALQLHRPRPPGSGLQVPTNAKQIHDGQYFRVFEIN